MQKKICRLGKSEITEFHELVKNVYGEFVSPDYSEEGNRTFYSYIDPLEIGKRLEAGNWFYACKSGGKIVGALEVRNKNHISLLFVDKRHQKQGISEALLERYFDDLKKEEAGVGFIEVNSSPYAKIIYKNLGFYEASDLQEKNGIKFYYMKMDLE